MNELIFFLHVVTIISFLLGSLYFGPYALVAIISLQAVLSNLFVTKQIVLFGLSVTPTDVFSVGTILGLNLLQEFYGQNIAKKTIYISFFVLFFYLLMSQFQVLYLPSQYDLLDNSFKNILKFMPRITIASFISYFLVQMLDFYLYGFLKNLFKDKNLVLRNFISITIVQFIDTLLFSILALYGLVQSLFDIILLSFLVKLIVIGISLPFVAIAKKILKN